MERVVRTAFPGAQAHRQARCEAALLSVGAAAVVGAALGHATASLSSALAAAVIAKVGAVLAAR